MATAYKDCKVESHQRKDSCNIKIWKYIKDAVWLFDFSQCLSFHLPLKQTIQCYYSKAVEFLECMRCRRCNRDGKRGLYDWIFREIQKAFILILRRRQKLLLFDLSRIVCTIFKTICLFLLLPREQVVVSTRLDYTALGRIHHTKSIIVQQILPLRYMHVSTSGFPWLRHSFLLLT